MAGRSELRRLREDAGLSLRGLAARVGCSHQTIFLVEHGKLPLRPDLAIKIRATIGKVMELRRLLAS